MAVNPSKLALLEALKQKRLNYVSGEVLARELNVSRTAIWKHIKSLRKDGYIIEPSPKLGYKYMAAPDKLLPLEILHNLKTNYLGRRIIHFLETDSTQDVAKEMVVKGAPEGTLIIAEGQSKGRGRLGRTWLSPQGQGIYLSLILRPHISPIHAPKITLMAAVSIVQAIEAITPVKAQIKWPNDILISHRKVAGILTEIDAEMDRTNAIILGIGININNHSSSFSSELRDTVTSLRMETGREISRLGLLQTLLLDLENLYETFKAKGFTPILGIWKKKDITVGSYVKAVLIDRELVGQAVDIDHEGALILRDEKGNTHRIISGDVTLLRIR